MTSTPPACDTHAHVFTTGLHMAADARYVPDYEASVADYLAELDRWGIGRGVLVQPSFLGSDNSFLLAALAQHADRLRGVIVIDLDQVDHELSHATIDERADAGVRGIRLNLIGREVPDLSSAPFFRGARAMASRGWHLEIQAAGPQWASLAPAIEAWPGRVVVDHLGLPGVGGRESLKIVVALASRQNVWVKVSAPYRSASRADAIEMLRRIADEAGVQRLVTGSDWPHTGHEAERGEDPWAWLEPVLGPSTVSELLTFRAADLLDWPEGS